MAKTRRKRPLLDRFMAFALPEPTSGCWLWLGAVNPDGYAKFKTTGEMRGAHRVAHEIFTGEIPAGYQVDHLCRVRCCVNPKHLEAVTPLENTQRGAAVITHCPQGHPYAGENLYSPPCHDRVTHRVCKECNRTASREWQRRKARAANPN